jgi:ABC-type Co2+ transport system permease subunit
MTFSDYLFDSVLILLVLRQIRESRLDRRAILLPLGIVAYVANSYLKTIPTTGNSLVLIIGLALVGISFGAIGALATRVRVDGQPHALVKAGWISAGLWVFSMGFRMGFAIWASNGGGPSLERFSIAHHINGNAWTAALVLMALGEVVTRVGMLVYRGYRAQETARVAGPQLVAVKQLAA